jgi:hypothetical protein
VSPLGVRSSFSSNVNLAHLSNTVEMWFHATASKLFNLAPDNPK